MLISDAVITLALICIIISHQVVFNPIQFAVIRLVFLTSSSSCEDKVEKIWTVTCGPSFCV